MSATNFYHTLYQTDSIFRLPNESWDTNTQSSIDLPLQTVTTPSATTNESDLLAELDILSAQTLSIESISVYADTSLVDTIETTFLPEPVVFVPTPEPLPQPAPRPTMPSVLPPLQQQTRLPQLNHKVLLLADEELDPSNLLFLEKILKAVNLNIDGVDLLNLHGVRDMNFAELLRGKYINHFITFGVPFERLDLDIMMDRYAPVRFEGITFLMADSLPTIEADQVLKKRLWSALQRVFLQR